MSKLVLSYVDKTTNLATEKTFKGLHDASILSKLHQDRTSEVSFCDVIISVGGENVRAHKVVLAMYSKFFTEMFQMETDENDLGSMLEDLDPQAVRTIVDYIYTTYITITRDNAVHLIAAAELLVVPDVKDYCIQFLSEFTSVKQNVPKPQAPPCSVQNFPNVSNVRTIAVPDDDSSSSDRPSHSPLIPGPCDFFSADRSPSSLSVTMTPPTLFEERNMKCEPARVNAAQTLPPTCDRPSSSSCSFVSQLDDGEISADDNLEVSIVPQDIRGARLDATSSSPAVQFSSNRLLAGFLFATDIINLLLNTNVEYLPSIPPGRKENVFFVVDKKDNPRLPVSQRYADDCGPWQLITYSMAYYCASNQKYHEMKKHKKVYCKRTSTGYSPYQPQPLENQILKLYKIYNKHSLDENYKRRITWLQKLPAHCKPVCIVEYSGTSPK